MKNTMQKYNFLSHSIQKTGRKFFFFDFFDILPSDLPNSVVKMDRFLWGLLLFPEKAGDFGAESRFTLQETPGKEDGHQK